MWLIPTRVAFLFLFFDMTSEPSSALDRESGLGTAPLWKAERKRREADTDADADTDNFFVVVIDF